MTAKRAAKSVIDGDTSRCSSGSTVGLAGGTRMPAHAAGRIESTGSLIACFELVRERGYGRHVEHRTGAKMRNALGRIGSHPLHLVEPRFAACDVAVGARDEHVVRHSTALVGCAGDDLVVAAPQRFGDRG